MMINHFPNKQTYIETHATKIYRRPTRRAS